jgi:hypothetical protein
VKTRSSSWTGDGGACGRRNLLGGVVSRDTVRFDGMVGLLLVVVPAGGDKSVGGHVKRGLPTSRQDVCFSVGGRESSLGHRFGRLQHFAAPGVAWQAPVRCGTALRRRLRQRQLVMTWPTADRGGVFSTTELSRCGTSSEDGVGDFPGLWLDGGGFVRGKAMC